MLARRRQSRLALAPRRWPTHVRRHSASESPSVASGSMPERQVLGPEQHAQARQALRARSYTAPVGWCTLSASSARTVEERVGVAGGDRGVHAGRVRGRGVRAHAAANGARPARHAPSGSSIRSARRRPAARRARSASSVAPLASHSSMARASSASASLAAAGGAQRRGERAGARRRGRAARRSRRRSRRRRARARRPRACSPRRASASARTPRQAIAALRSSPASASLSWLSASASAARPCASSARPSSAAACAASIPSPWLAQPVVRGAQAALGGDGVALEQLDEPGEDVGFEQPLRDAELFDHAPRRRDHAPRRLGAPAQRFEHGLTAQRDGLDRGRALRDAQHAHDVEAAAAGARHRARSPQRGERRAGEHGVRAPPIVRAPRGGERAVERGLAGADLAETRERERVHGVGLRLAGGVARRRQLVRRGRDRVGGGAQRLRIGEHGELAGEAGVPRAQAIRAAGEAAELGDRARRRADVAGGEQRLAPVEREIGARGIRRVEPIERASEQARRQRQVVARERPPAGRREIARRALAEGATLRVDRAELAQVLVRLLEVPADRLVVLDGLADAASRASRRSGRAAPRACPSAGAGRRRRGSARGGSAAPARRGTSRRRARSARCAAAIRAARRDRAQLARQQVRDGGARELPPDDRGALQHACAPPDAAARCGRRAARGWWAASRGRRARPPAIQRSPSRLSAPSCTSMRTSSPTKSGLPSLVASTRPATAAGSSSAPITFAASRVAAPASRPRERHDVGHEAAGASPATSACRAARVAPPRGRAAARRCSTAPGARSRSSSSGSAHCRSSIASTTGCAAASAASKRRTTKKVSSGDAGVPASSAAMPSAMRARSASSPGTAASIAARRASPLRRRRGAAARAAPRRAARRWRRRPRRSARSAPSPRRRGGGRTRRAGATCRGPASRGSRRVARGAPRRPRRRPP